MGVRAMAVFLSVVVHDPDVPWAALSFRPLDANPPLHIDADAYTHHVHAGQALMPRLTGSLSCLPASMNPASRVRIFLAPWFAAMAR